MDVAAQQLGGLVTQHLRRGGVDDGDAASQIDTDDAVTHRLENGIRLANERAQLLLGANLFGDVDGEAQHRGLAPFRLDQPVPVGENVLFAQDVAQVQQALRLTGADQFIQIQLHEMQALGEDKLLDGVADDFFHAQSQAAGPILVDGKNPALKIMRTDQAERPFNELPVARFAFTDGVLRRALHGHVDSRGDDERDLPL